ncbi:MAG TPA: four helix bundle protein [Gemmataceae bacterium]|nr:four helix bundle protein [Gemmataceae bacterium]
MKSKSFEQLRVYRLAEDLADSLWDIAGAWNSLARDTVGKQGIRAADGIGANIAEGYGRGSYADNRRFVRMARGSLYEVRHWLRRAYRRRLLTRTQIERLKTTLDNLGPQLNAYLKSIGPGTGRNHPND